MPDGVTDVGMKNILTFEEIWEIVRAGVSLGITHVRITGGEPLVRKGLGNSGCRNDHNDHEWSFT